MKSILIAVIFVCGCSMMVDEESVDASIDSDTISASVSGTGSDSETTTSNQSNGSEDSDSETTSGGATETGSGGTETEGTEVGCIGQAKCANATTVLSCNDNGEWIVSDTCTGTDTCIDGKCACNPSPTGGRFCQDNKVYSAMTCGPGVAGEDCGFDGNTCMKNGIVECGYDENNDPYKECKLGIGMYDRAKCVTQESDGLAFISGYRRLPDGKWQGVPTVECPYGCNQIDLCTAECY